MKKKFTFLAFVIMLVTFAVFYKISHISNAPVEEFRFECVHGIKFLDVLTDRLEFNGVPIELTYSFSNGFTRSTFGLMCFLDGELQPFILDGQEKLIHTVAVEPDTTKTLQLSFVPITGQAGEELPLHIIALFDVDASFNAPTLAPAFYHAMSQAFPVRVYMKKDTPNNSSSIIPESRYKICWNKDVHFLPNEDGESSPDMYFLTTEDRTLVANGENKSCLLNVSDSETTFRIYAYINHSPISSYDDTLYYEITVPAHASATISFTVHSDSTYTDDEFYLIAVPLHDSSIQEGTQLLKTDTVLVP